MPTTTQLYAWAVPAFIDESPVDPTWVTSYDNRTQNFADIAAVIAANQDYWFCWGDYHAKGGTPSSPSGFLGSQSGDLNVARCLVQPNADCSSTYAARGTIFTYGVDGVCHQLANQVLYSTRAGGAQPLTVAKARGYWVSTAIYGTYGLQHAAWSGKIAACTAAAARALARRGKARPKMSAPPPAGLPPTSSHNGSPTSSAPIACHWRRNCYTCAPSFRRRRHCRRMRRASPRPTNSTTATSASSTRRRRSFLRETIRGFSASRSA